MSGVSEKFEELLNSNIVCLTLLFVFCFASFGLPLLSGLPSGYDMVTDIRFASALRDAMLAGDLFPGWANDNFGFGSIGIRFYPPIAFYGLAVTEMITADWFWALWSNLLFWMFLSSAGIFFFVKEWGTPTQGLIAGIGYAIVPQHLSEVFQFFLFAEFAAWGLIPFCFLFITRICRKGTWIDVVLFAISYSLLILTHLPTTIIVSFCLPIYVLVALDWRNYRTVFIRLAVAIALTIGATSFRWVTIISEFDWVAHNDPKWANGYYQYAAWLFPNTLTSRSQFLYVLSSWLFDIAIVMSVALIIPAIVYLIKARTLKAAVQWRIIAASVTVTALAFFMLSKPSQSIWDALPFLQKLQFPWRWLSVLSFGAVVAFAMSVPRLLELLRVREQRFVAYPALGLVVTIILFNITQIIIPSAPIPFAKFNEVEEKVAEEPMFEGWWPTWAKADAFVENTEPFADGRAIQISSWDNSSKVTNVSAGGPTNLIVPVFYYPHWNATVNGDPAVVSSNENGVIAIAIPAQAVSVRLSFEEPFRKIVAGWISMVVWIILGLLLIARFAQENFLSRAHHLSLGDQFNGQEIAS
jgi:uncharacterized membrane protein